MICGCGCCREHLDRAADGSDDDGLVDLDTVVEAIEASAQALEDWYAGAARAPATGPIASTPTGEARRS